MNVSVKLSALFSQFDPIDPVGTGKAVASRLRPILTMAKKTGAFVNFDMEQYSFKDTTLQIFRDVLTEPEFHWPDVGTAIQVYLKGQFQGRLTATTRMGEERPQMPSLDSPRQGGVLAIAAQNHWPVPVFTEKWQSDANYEKLTRFLLENHAY